MELKRIGVLSLAKVMASIYAVLGLVGGLIWGLILVIGSTFGAFAADSAEPLLGIFFGVGAVFLLPIMYGLIGFVMGLIVAAVYNLVSSKLGGLELQLE